ncbi:hypothetical protein [Cellulomonas sp.]|uniref:hypothetical protein n=1 Tax=Cellulomonas sp. TaxID=40001 RepID=UPI003BA9C33A
MAEALAVVAGLLGLLAAWSGGAVFHFGRRDRWNSAGHWGATAEALGAALAGMAAFVVIQHGNDEPIEPGALLSTRLLVGVAGVLAVIYLCLLVVLTPSVPGSRRRRLTWKARAGLTDLTVGELLPGVAILLSAVLLLVAATR